MNGSELQITNTVYGDGSRVCRNAEAHPHMEMCREVSVVVALQFADFKCAMPGVQLENRFLYKLLNRKDR